MQYVLPAINYSLMSTIDFISISLSSNSVLIRYYSLSSICLFYSKNYSLSEDFQLPNYSIFLAF